MEDLDRDFLEAVEDGRRNDVIELLRQGACVNASHQGTGDSALMIACEKGHMDIVRILLDHKADMSHRNATGACVVHSAVSRDDVEAIELLYHRGADFNCIDMHGNTPLHLAVSKRFIRSTKKLLKYGADANICDSGFHRAPLHDAVRHRDFRSAQMLLENEASVDVQDVSGATPLHEAVADDNLHLARLLLKYGADVTLRENIGHLTPFKAARSRDMRQLLTLFVERARRDSSRSSDIDSGTQSLHSSHDNILSDSHSLHGSRESIFSLPAIKLNENLPYDTDAERRLIRRIRSRSVEKSVLVEFSSPRAKASSSLERDLNRIDVLDKTEYMTRGRRHRPRKRVSVTPHRAHSLESVYDVSKGSLRGYRFSWSPQRGRSRSNSQEKHTPLRQYTEPPLTPYKSRLRRDLLEDRDYLAPRHVDLEVRVVVNPKPGASKDTDNHSDGESGISSTASGFETPSDSRKQYSSRSRGSAMQEDDDFHNPGYSQIDSEGAASTRKASNVTRGEYVSESTSTGMGQDLVPVHGAEGTRASDHDTSDDDVLDTYEEELITKKRPVRIYSSIEDLSIVTSDGKGITLKEDELDDAGKKRVSPYIEHKITKMNRHKIIKGLRKLSDDVSRDDRSEISADGLYAGSPVNSPLLRHSSHTSDTSRSSETKNVFTSKKDMGDNMSMTAGMQQRTKSVEITAAENKGSGVLYSQDTEAGRKRDFIAESEQTPDGVSAQRERKGPMRPSADIPQVHSSNGAVTVTMAASRDEIQPPGAPYEDREETVDTSSYMENIYAIRKSFEAATAKDRLVPQKGNITNTLQVNTITKTENYEAVDAPEGKDGHSQGTGKSPMLVKQDSFEAILPGDSVPSSGDYISRRHITLVKGPKTSHDNDDVYTQSIRTEQSSDNNALITDSHTERGESGHDVRAGDRIETESELSQDEYASLHSSIRGQMYLQSQAPGESIRRKRGSLTPVGAVVRKELEIGRSDSELEEDFRDRAQEEEDVTYTHYDVTQPLASNTLRSSVKSSEMQTSTVESGDQGGSSSDAETLTSGDVNDDVNADDLDKLADSMSGSSDHVAMETRTRPAQNLRDVMQSKIGSAFELGMAPSSDFDAVTRKKDHANNKSSKLDPDTTESELSDYDRDYRRNQTTDEEMSHAPRMSGASSPEPEWDRTFTYDDDALLTGQHRKPSRKSTKTKTKATRTKNTAVDEGNTETQVLKSDKGVQSQNIHETTVEGDYAHPVTEPEVVARETDYLSTGTQNDGQAGMERLVSSSYGAFDMYEKPPEKVNESTEANGTSFWGRLCGCCYNFGLY